MQENNSKFNFFSVSDAPIGFWKTKIEKLDISQWVKEVYKFKEFNPKSTQKSNNGGYQSENNLYNCPAFFSLIDLILKNSNSIIGTPNFKLTEMWANVSSYGHSNTLHNHGPYGKTLSGVLYLKTPPNSGNLQFILPFDLNNYYPYTPQEGDLIIFPAFLSHSVEPNLSQEDRISIAFNYG